MLALPAFAALACASVVVHPQLVHVTVRQKELHIAVPRAPMLGANPSTTAAKAGFEVCLACDWGAEPGRDKTPPSPASLVHIGP